MPQVLRRSGLRNGQPHPTHTATTSHTARVSCAPIPAEQTTRRRNRRLALAAVLLVGLSYATLIQNFSWNQTSHYDLLQALYHEQTTIDPYERDTGDKVLYHGHWYSARARASRCTCCPGTPS